MSLLLKYVVIAPLIMLASDAYADWEYNDRKDPFEDTDRSSITATVDMYEEDEALLIGVSCQADGLNIMLSHSYMAGDSDDEIRVQMRVDQNEAYGPTYWGLAAENRASWMPMRDVPDMIAQMKAGRRLVIRAIDPFDGDSLNQAVSLFGFSAIVERLSCYAGP